MKQSKRCSHRDLQVFMQRGTVIKQKAGLIDGRPEAGLVVSFWTHEQTRDTQGGRRPGESLFFLTCAYCWYK